MSGLVSLGARRALDTRCVSWTWDMTEEELPGTFEGKFRIDPPSKQYMLLRLTKVEA